jgi:phosphate-selective porin OprO/OprP
VNTGPLAVDDYTLVGVEAAARCGALYLQSEVVASVVDQLAADSAVFHGMYLQGGYFLTGETRPYNRKAGVFGRVVPLHPFSRDGGCGAWEVTARWSMIDLNDAGVTGGRLNDATAGLNWYLNQYSKFQLNYIHAFLDSPVNGKSDAGLTAVRAQLDF